MASKSVFTLTVTMGALTTTPIPERVPPIPIARLTPRQRRVVASLAAGKTLVEIGDELNISRQAVWQMIEAIKGRASELMDEFGITEAALVNQYLKPAL